MLRSSFDEETKGLCIAIKEGQRRQKPTSHTQNVFFSALSQARRKTSFAVPEGVCGYLGNIKMKLSTGISLKSIESCRRAGMVMPIRAVPMLETFHDIQETYIIKILL
jgi:hypothetical protein